MDGNLIWWTSQQECEAIGFDSPATFPEYLADEYQSRLGRNGRGRLWIHASISQGDIEWPADKPAARLAGVRGGIVIRAADAPIVFGLPGFLTDTELNLINALEE